MQGAPARLSSAYQYQLPPTTMAIDRVFAAKGDEPTRSPFHRQEKYAASTSFADCYRFLSVMTKNEQAALLD
jgi:hypothetical protein